MLYAQSSKFVHSFVALGHRQKSVLWKIRNDKQYCVISTRVNVTQFLFRPKSRVDVIVNAAFLPFAFLLCLIYLNNGGLLHVVMVRGFV